MDEITVFPSFGRKPRDSGVQHVSAKWYWLAAVIIIPALGCGSGTVDPSPGIHQTKNPLVAQYTIAVPHKGSTAWAEFGPDASYGRQTLTTTPTASDGQSVSIFVAGMKPSTKYHMRAHVTWQGGEWIDQDQVFITGALPTSSSGGPVVPVMSVSGTAGNSASPGIELLDLEDPPNTYTLSVLATDLNGNVIWYYDIGAGNVASPVKILPNGNVIMAIGPSSSVIREIDLAGDTIRELSAGTLSQELQSLGHNVNLNGFHHDIAILPNGHLIVLANLYQAYTNLPGYPGTTNVLGDVLIDLDPNWNPVWYWSTFDHLDVNRHLMGFPDWTHSNTIVYDPRDGNLLLSIRHQSWVIKINYQNGGGNGDIMWRLGEDGDFTLTPNDPSQWFYGQHFPAIVSQNGSNTTLSVMDNGNVRVVDSSGDACTAFNRANADCYSRAVTFQIDENAKTASVLWQDKPGGLFSWWGGDTLVLPNKDIEFDLCAPFGYQIGSEIMEVTPDAVPQLVWELDVSGVAAYRGYRVPSLYPGVAWQN